MHEVGLLRVPLVFGRAHADFTLSEEGAVATNPHRSIPHWRTAASKVAMRSGRHFVQFMAVGGNNRVDIMIGVIRPGWDVEGGAVAEEEDEEVGRYVEEADGHCFYSTYDGYCLPRIGSWERGGDREGAGQHDRLEE